jgi:hypothetical protein
VILKTQNRKTFNSSGFSPDGKMSEEQHVAAIKRKNIVSWWQSSSFQTFRQRLTCATILTTLSRYQIHGWHRKTAIVADARMELMWQKRTKRNKSYALFLNSKKKEERRTMKKNT